MSGIGDIFGQGKIGEQLLVWGLASQVIQALTGPTLREVENVMNEQFQAYPLAVGDAAELVARALMSAGDGEAEAAKNGLSPGHFRDLVRARQSAPALSALLDLYRRTVAGVGEAGVSEAELDKALADLAIRPEWREHVKKLATEPPSWQQALNALLQGQLTEDQAKSWFVRGGGELDAFDWLFNANGTAPTPVELSVMANRGLIPWDGEGPHAVSFHQGFLEGPWRNKWEEPFRKLAAYHPPPRTVTALVRAGSLSHEQALTLLRQQGLSAELAAAYLADAEHHTTTAHKHLAQSDVITLYQQHLLSEADAVTALTATGYSATDAALVLKVAQVRRSAAELSTAVGRVRSLFVGHKLDTATARADLVALGVPAAQAASVIETWTLERSANHRPLTEAQVADAFKADLMTQDEAQAQLEGMGYHPHDAWVLLSLKHGSRLPNEPGSAPRPIS